MSLPSHLVSLTFDDALDVHLDRVVPLLEKQGVRGTFFVTIGAPSLAARVEEWRGVAARGHELGNHTILHPAVRGKWYVTEGNAIEYYTLDRMRVELEAANRILAGIDGQGLRTFAYPCCNTVLGMPGLAKRLLRAMHLDRTRLMGLVDRFRWLDVGSLEMSYEPVVAELFAAGRTGGDQFSAGKEFPPARSMIPGVSLDGKSSAEIDAILSNFMGREHGWLVFMAHGVGGGHRLSCDQPVFEGLLKELHSSGAQVVTFREAARIVYGGQCVGSH